MPHFQSFTKIVLVFVVVLILIPHSANSVNRKNAKIESLLVQSNDMLSVFVDCSHCDLHFIRENITFVNYVRLKEQAHIHLLIVPQWAGASGTTYIISFVGYKQFQGMNNSLTYWAPGTNSWEETRRGLTDILKLGLAPYVANTNLAKHMAVTFMGNKSFERQQVVDPWNSWVFEVYGGGNFRKEESQSSLNARYGFWADRITEELKLRFRPYFNHNQRLFIADGNEIRSKSHSHGLDSYAIKSITDHLSAGAFLTMFSSTFHNINFSWDLTPAIEYSLFPYKEASSRSITFVYRIGYSRNDYIEETIFGKHSEMLLRHSINASVRYQQTWGSVRAGLTGSHYFHDFDANRAELWARINLRLFSGFSLSLDGNFDLTNDLVSLPKGEMSLEDILLQQRRQASAYSMYGSVGLSYTFGSKFSNVVNTRL